MAHPVGKQERGAFFWADSLRFVAATLVVMEHSRDLMFKTFGEVTGLSALWKLFYFATGLGSEAVIVFFVLSGFWITSAVDRRIDNADFWPAYLIDRLSRLMIVVIPALVLGGLLDMLSIHWLHSAYTDGHSGALTVTQSIGDHLTPGLFLANLVFLQKLVFGSFGSNEPLWSLAYEFWYYIWFPSLLLLLTRRRLSFGLLALGMGFVSLHFVQGFVVWLMGSSLYYLDRRMAKAGRADWSGPWTVIAVLASGLVFVAGLAASRVNLPVLGTPIALGAAFAQFLWVLLRTNPRPLKIGLPFARYGAKASFSLYAMHFPFMLAVISAIPPGVRVAPSVTRLLEWIGLCLLTIAFGWAFARLTEAHTGQLRARLRARLIAPHTQAEAA